MAVAVHLDGLALRRLCVDRLGDVADGLVVRDHLGGFCDDGERAENLADVAPPRLAEAAVPVDSDAQTFGERGLLVPSELAQLGAVDSVAVVVERPVVRVLDPSLELLGRVVRDAHLLEELAAQIKVADLVVRADVVDVAHLALVEDGVEGIRCVTGEEVSPGGRTVTVKHNRLAAVQERRELGDNLCSRMPSAAVYVWAQPKDKTVGR